MKEEAGKMEGRDGKGQPRGDNNDNTRSSRAEIFQIRFPWNNSSSEEE